MPTKIAYSISATATGGGRNGHSRTADGAVDVNLVVPKEMGGPGGDGVNPEQLFATGYAACFLGALRFYAGQQKVKVPGPGVVSVSGKGIKPRSVEAGGKESVSLTIKATGSKKKKLKKKGKVKVKATFEYTPTGGDPNTETAKIKLKRKR